MAFFHLLFSPTGRINRATWWVISLANFILVIFLIIITVLLIAAFTNNPEAAGAEPEPGQAGMAGLINLAFLPAMWISVAAGVKRYHDRGKTGFWYLIAFIPLIGPIWQLVELGFLPGESSANDHGGAPGGGLGMTRPAASAKTSSSEPVWNRKHAPAQTTKTAPVNKPRAHFGLRGAP